MEGKKNFYQVIEQICEEDSRYKPDSYEFVLQSLHYTQKKLKRQTHITGVELLEGIREFAIEQYGAMSWTVLKYWGINKTEDFGNIVFNMVNKGVLSKTDTDTINDFKNIYDFKKTFGNVLRDSIKKMQEKT